MVGLNVRGGAYKSTGVVLKNILLSTYQRAAELILLSDAD